MATTTTEPKNLTERDEEDVRRWLEWIHGKLGDRRHQREVEAGKVDIYLGNFPEEDAFRHEPKEKVKARIQEILQEEGWGDVRFPGGYHSWNLSLRNPKVLRADQQRIAQEKFNQSANKTLKVLGITLAVVVGVPLFIVIGIPILLLMWFFGAFDS